MRIFAGFAVFTGLCFIGAPKVTTIVVLGGALLVLATGWLVVRINPGALRQKQ